MRILGGTDSPMVTSRDMKQGSGFVDAESHSTEVSCLGGYSPACAQDNFKRRLMNFAYTKYELRVKIAHKL